MADSLARGTRGLGRPSFDARSRSQPCHPSSFSLETEYEEENRREGSGRMGLSAGTVGVLFVLAERAASEGPRSTRPIKHTPTIPFDLEK